MKTDEIKGADLRACKVTVVDVEVRLVVDTGGAVVEISRADGSPYFVYHHDFAVEPGRLILVDLGAPRSSGPHAAREARRTTLTSITGKLPIRKG